MNTPITPWAVGSSPSPRETTTSSRLSLWCCAGHPQGDTPACLTVGNRHSYVAPSRWQPHTINWCSTALVNVSTIQASTAVVKVNLHRVTSTVGPLSPHANLGDDVHFSVDHSSTVECSDRGTLVRNEVVMVSRLSMDLKTEWTDFSSGSVM